MGCKVSRKLLGRDMQMDLLASPLSLLLTRWHKLCSMSSRVLGEASAASPLVLHETLPNFNENALAQFLLTTELGAHSLNTCTGASPTDQLSSTWASYKCGWTPASISPIPGKMGVAVENILKAPSLSKMVTKE